MLDAAIAIHVHPAELSHIYGRLSRAGLISRPDRQPFARAVLRRKFRDITLLEVAQAVDEHVLSCPLGDHHCTPGVPCRLLRHVIVGLSMSIADVQTRRVPREEAAVLV